MKKQAVIVFGKHYMPALGAIRSLGEAGFPVYLIFVSKKQTKNNIAAVSRFIQSYSEIITDKDQDVLNFLIEYMKKVEPKTILFPIDDYSILFFSKYKRELEYYWFPHSFGQKSLLELMDKSIQADYAKKAGLNCAKQWIIDLTNCDEEMRINEVKYPCFCKPLMSVKGSKQEMRRCGDIQELNRAILSMKNSNSQRSILIQEFLNVNEEIDISGISVNGKVNILGIIRKIVVARYNKGPTEVGEIINSDVLGKTKDELCSFIRSLSFDGIFDIELFICDGKYYFNELNLRPTGVIYALTKNGINIPSMFVSQIYYGTEINPQIQMNLRGTFISEKVVDEDYIHGLISQKERKKLYRLADYGLIKSPLDKRPFLIYKRGIIKSILKREIKNFISLMRLKKG